MSTKDHNLFLRGKSATFNSSISKHDNQQYRNLNLNGIHQSDKIDPIFHSSKNNSFKNDERNFNDFNNSKAKNNFNSFNKNQKSSQNLLSLFSDAVKEEKENRWKKKKDNDTKKDNNSTLSLHISAYENSIEASAASASDSNGDKKDDDKGLSKSMKNAKFALTSSSSKTPKMPSPFEIPRQQQDQRSEPEIMQFLASQQLVNPNTTGSASNEIVSPSDYITRACLGRTAQIGDVYDVRNEQLCKGVNIFEKQLPSDVITVINNQSVSSECITSNKISDKLAALNLHGELDISLLVGLIEGGSGSIGFIDGKSSFKESIQQFSFIQKIRTVDEKIDINAATQLIASNIGEFDGTHVVVGISWGGNSVVTMEYENSKDESEKENIENVFEKFKMLALDDSDEKAFEDNKFAGGVSVKVYADMNPSGLQLPSNFNEAKEYLNAMEKSYVNIKGKQMELQLLPLKVFQKALGFQQENIRESTVFSIEMSTIKRVQQLFDTIFESNEMLTKLAQFVSENEKYVAAEDKTAIESCTNNFGSAAVKMRDELRDLVQKVRSGAAEAYEIEVLRTLFEKNPNTSPSNIKTFVDSYNYLHEKLDFVKECQQNDILIINEADQFASIKRENQKIEIFMLFCSFKNDTSTPESAEHVKYFFDLQNQENEKLLAVVDTDVLPNIVKNELLPDGIRVVQCFNGQYISDDCLELQKKLDSQCLVACDNILQNHETLIKAVSINFPCPKCSAGEKEWFCAICREQIVYNFDGNFYCGCGYNTVEEFAFKCCDPNHGSGYIKFSKDVLENLIAGIKPLQEINILVIGETGVGKSTWINALANYITHETMNEVLSDDLINLIPTKFELTQKRDGQLIQKSIRVGGTSDNENFSEGQSSTQQSKAYTFRHNNSLYRIIDTPGIGDSRGIEQDKKNMENIMQYISKYKEIHGICVLMKPNEARLTPSFEFCFKELLVQFHRSAIENIVFCFTQTSGFNFEVGQTLTPLNVLLDEIEKKQKITIPTSEERMYSFDNMAYRYLCAVKRYRSEFPPDQEELYEKAYNISKEVTQKMLDYFLKRKAHNVEESISIYRARNVIRRLMQPMAMINAAMEETLEKVKNKQNLIQKFIDDEEELKKILIKIIPFKRWYSETYPALYCKTCETTEYYYGDDRLQFLEASPHAMDKDPYILETPTHYLKSRKEKCYQCGPNTKVVFNKRWICHETGTREEEDTTVAGQMKEKLKTRKGIIEEIENVQKLKKELTAENDAIVKAAARFAHFLGRYSITPYNDATEKYLKQLIKKEEKMGTESKKLLYEKLLSQYEAEKMVLEKELKNASKFADKTITVSDIMEIVDSLKKLKHYGRNIASAIGECNKAILYEASAEEMEVELPKKKRQPSFFKRFKNFIGI